MLNLQRAAVPVAIGGLLACGILVALAWGNGLGECNATTAPHDDSTGLLRTAVAIAFANLALCVGVWRPLRATERLLVLLTGLATSALGAIAVAFLAEVNFRGC